MMRWLGQADPLAGQGIAHRRGFSLERSVKGSLRESNSLKEPFTDHSGRAATSPGLLAENVIDADDPAASTPSGS
ncbi:hypothetical protein GCM10009565_68270 [Amycolatopsis albidoflavus]